MIIQSFVLAFMNDTESFVVRTKKDNVDMVDMLDKRKVRTKIVSVNRVLREKVTQ